MTGAGGLPAEPLGHALAEGVYSVYYSLQEAVHEMLDKLDLTEALADAIWQLDPAEGPKSRRALAGQLHCDPSNVTLIVDRLEERGLVQSSPDRSDRRVCSHRDHAAPVAPLRRARKALPDPPSATN